MIGTCECLTNQSDDADIRCHRRLEETMVVIRWIAALLCLAILLLVPPAFPTPGIMATAGLAVGNLTIMICLRRAHQPRCYRIIGGIASALEWLTAIGMIVACSAAWSNPLLATLIILLIIDAVRYGVAGVIVAWIAAEVAVGAMMAAQMMILHALRPTLGMATLMRWEVVLSAAMVVVGLFLRFGEERIREIRAQWEQERARLLQRVNEEVQQRQAEHIALQRFQLRISRIEWELLPLLAREELTYEQIATLRSVSPETIRTHVHHLGEKLGVAGRRAIAAAARERGLVSPRE